MLEAEHVIRRPAVSIYTFPDPEWPELHLSFQLTLLRLGTISEQHKCRFLMSGNRLGTPNTSNQRGVLFLLLEVSLFKAVVR